VTWEAEGGDWIDLKPGNPSLQGACLPAGPAAAYSVPDMKRDRPDPGPGGPAGDSECSLTYLPVDSDTQVALS
jgi:hypothetical protein